jgi:hypothetical protein
MSISSGRSTAVSSLAHFFHPGPGKGRGRFAFELCVVSQIRRVKGTRIETNGVSIDTAAPVPTDTLVPAPADTVVPAPTDTAVPLPTVG